MTKKAAIPTIALPALIVFAVVHLALWPGQMSPDSIDQWEVLVSGGGTDAQPAFWTLLNVLAFKLWPHPAFVIAVQYIIFSLSSAVLIRECHLAGAPAWSVVAMALVSAFLPPSFLIGTTLWKDVPYASGLLILTAGVWRLARQQYRLTPRLAVWLLVGGALVEGTRYNGILTIGVTGLALLVAAPRGRKLQLAAIGALFGVFGLACKYALPSVLGLSPASPAYQAIFAMPFIGAMVADGEETELVAEDRALIESVMPIDQWRQSYRCNDVGPLFFGTHTNLDVVAQNAGRLNAIAGKWILSSPSAALRHQACMTSVLWNPIPRDNEWIPIAPLEVTGIPTAAELGLKTRSLIPSLADWIRKDLMSYVGLSHTYNRPATYFLIGLVAIAWLASTLGGAAWVAYTPAIGNVIGLAAVVGTPDYRYMWPTEAVAVIIITAAAALAVARVGGREPVSAPKG